MRIVGHRGTPTTGSSPENTVPAVLAALAAGADGVEVDVRTTSDGVLVLSHDPDLGRVLGTGPGTGPLVAETPWAALRHLALPGGARVPRLSEVLDLAARHGAHVVTEVKADPGPQRLRTAAHLAALLTLRRQVRPGADRVTTSSFDPLCARRLAGRGTVGGAVIVKAHVPPRPLAAPARAHGLSELHLQLEHVTRDPDIVRHLHAQGLRVAAGTDDPDAVEWLAGLGVDLLCTDAVAPVVRGRQAARARAGAPTAHAGAPAAAPAASSQRSSAA